jgi:hypothetical protein
MWLGYQYFLPMTLCKCCSLAKIQPHSLSLFNRVPHQHFAYDTALRNLHWGRPNIWFKPQERIVPLEISLGCLVWQIGHLTILLATISNCSVCSYCCVEINRKKLSSLDHSSVLCREIKRYSTRKKREKRRRELSRLFCLRTWSLHLLWVVPSVPGYALYLIRSASAKDCLRTWTLFCLLLTVCSGPNRDLFPTPRLLIG